MQRLLLGFVMVLLLSSAAAATDELRLKDGTKIIGTIVGFEDNSFKVQTSYGYAMVRKEAVVSIFVTEAKKEPAPEKPHEKKPAPAPAKAPAEPPATPQVIAAASPAGTPASPTPSATPPAAPAAPQPVREEVEGNSYFNLSYGFQMYKPPSWHVIEDARKMLPNAIVAMGTGDQTTLLVVGREPFRGSLDALANSTEQQLTEIYENYRALGGQKITVSGVPALERRFRATVDQHDWSGRVVWLPRGNQVYTVMGLTYADSDLIQVQENVIARTIASLKFTKP